MKCECSLNHIWICHSEELCDEESPEILRFVQNDRWFVEHTPDTFFPEIDCSDAQIFDGAVGGPAFQVEVFLKNSTGLRISVPWKQLSLSRRSQPNKVLAAFMCTLHKNYRFCIIHRHKKISAALMRAEGPHEGGRDFFVLDITILRVTCCLCGE